MHWEGEEMVSCQLLISLQTTCGFVWLCKIELRPVTSDYLFLELNLGQLQNWDLKRVFVKGKSQTTTPSLSLSLFFFFWVLLSVFLRTEKTKAFGLRFCSVQAP